MASALVSTPQIEKGYEVPLTELEQSLNTSKEEGLSTTEAQQRLVSYGPNQIITPSPSIWKVYLAPLFDILITVYLIMTGIMVILSIFVNDILSKVVFWLIMIAFNMTLAIVQNYKAQKKIEALKQLSPPKAKVLRDGEVTEIAAKELVPGDIVELALGDRIPADARIIESSNLTVNEASLTGESVAVKKAIDGNPPIDADTPIAKHENMVYLGTYVQTGSALVIIVRTGNETEIGRIATEMSEISDIDIPLRRRVNSLGKGLAVLMISFLIALMVFTGIQRSQEGLSLTFDQFAFDLSQAIINAMSVMPINIPLLVTVVLISGVLNMATYRVVIKELSVVETLGRCSVLCSDKTGTITTGKMTVKLIWDTNDYYQVWPLEDFRNQLAMIPDKWVSGDINIIPEEYTEIQEIERNSSIELLLTGAILNNDANITPITDVDGNTEYQIIGNFTDGALLVLSQTNGLDVEYVRSRYELEKSYPFDSSIKRMSGLFKDTQEDDYMVFSKGASEVILPRCTKIGDESEVRKMTKKERKEILKKVQYFADNGYRAISLAYKPVDNIYDGMDETEEREEVENNLIYIGFTIIYDPPRPNVIEAVSKLDSAGIFPIVITGDSPSTAGTIARQVGILDKDEIVVEGSQANLLSDDEFFKVSVFARVAPKDKEIIVSRYQGRGDVVAMTGDGVNDALAISRADAGIAMGISGTEVAKEAADIIITDDSYVSIVEGVYQGRNLYEKIRLMILFYIAVNLAEAIMYFSTSFRLDFYLLNNWQRVYIFAVVHAIPVLAIIFGPNDENIMLLKPRQNDALLPRKLIYSLMIFSISFGAVLLISYFIYYNSDFVNGINGGGISKILDYRPVSSDNLNDDLLPEDLAHAKARTMLLTIVYLVETLFVFIIMRINRPVWETIVEDANAFVYSMILSPLLIHFSLMYIAPLQRSLNNSGIAFELIPLSLLDWIVAILFSLIPLGLLEAYKYYVRVKKREQF